MAWIAATFFVFKQTHSVLATAYLSVAFFVPAVVLGPLSTRLSSRIGVARLFLCTALAVAAVAILPALVALTGHLKLSILLLWEFGQGCAIGLQGPSQGIVVRNFAPEGEVPEFNSKRMRAIAIASVLGFLLGGVMLKLLGPSWIFAVDCFSSLVLALSVLPELHREKTQTHRETMSLAFSVLKRDAALRSVFLMFAVVTLVGSIVVLFPSIADHLGKDASGVSVLNMAFALGGLFIVGSVKFLHKRVKWNKVVWGSTIMTFFFLLFLVADNYVAPSASLNFILILVVLLPLGFLVSLQTSILSSLVQIGSPKEAQNSVMELFALVPMIIIPVSEAAIGFLADHFSNGVALGSIGAVMLIVFYWGLRTHQRDALSSIDHQEIAAPLHFHHHLRGGFRSHRGVSTTQTTS